MQAVLVNPTFVFFPAGTAWIPGEMERMGNEVSASLNPYFNLKFTNLTPFLIRGICLFFFTQFFNLTENVT